MLRHLISFAILMIACGKSGKASFLLSITQAGVNVVGVGSGTINTVGLIDMGSSGGGGLIWGSYPVSGSAIGLGDPSAFVEGFTGLITGPNSFGSGPLILASSGAGDPVDIAPIVNTDPLFGAVFVPINYVSGSSLSDTSIWNGITISDLGLVPGIYKYTWGSEATADSFTISVRTTPEPNTLYVIGFLGSILFCFRKRIARRWNIQA